jgi:hypothetical protein
VVGAGGAEGCVKGGADADGSGDGWGCNGCDEVGCNGYDGDKVCGACNGQGWGWWGRHKMECDLIEEGALLISSIEKPSLRGEDLREELDGLAELVRQRLRARAQRDGVVIEGRAVVGDINYVLFEEKGFCGNQDNYYDPLNSYLHKVLERKTGIPIR